MPGAAVVCKERKATVLQRFKEAFSGVCLEHQSVDDARYLFTVAERIQQYAPPEKVGVPSAGQLRGATRLGGAVEQCRATLLYPQCHVCHPAPGPGDY